MTLTNLQNMEEPILDGGIGELVDSQVAEGIIYNLSDAQLIMGAQEGNHQYFTVFWNRYNGLMYGVAYNITRSPEVAEDVLQEAALKFYITLDSIMEPKKAAQFLGSIVRHKAIDNLRGKDVRDKYIMQEGDYNQGESESNPLDDVLAMELNRLLELAIEELPPKTKGIFLEYYQAGKRIKDIAHTRGISSGTVKPTLKNARDALGKYLIDNGYTLQDINEMNPGCLKSLFYQIM